MFIHAHIRVISSSGFIIKMLVYIFRITYRVHTMSLFLQAYAEELHEEVRKKLWGYSKNEDLSPSEMHGVQYKVLVYCVCFFFSSSKGKNILA